MTILNLCRPALLYFIISLLALVILIFQNIGSRNVYCIGSLSCQVPSVINIFVLKILYITFWTWILNFICKSGFVEVAWFLVLLPFILLFLPILYMIRMV
jgi:hypothetical protein